MFCWKIDTDRKLLSPNLSFFFDTQQKKLFTSLICCHTVVSLYIYML